MGGTCNRNGRDEHFLSYYTNLYLIEMRLEGVKLSHNTRISTGKVKDALLLGPYAFPYFTMVF
jgi:hypothetical protein